MTGLRDKFWRQFGTSLIGLALGLQLMLSSVSLIIASAAADPAAALEGHALCLGGGANETPADSQTPASPAHQPTPFCCLWHQALAIQPAMATPPAPITVVYTVPIPTPPVAFSPNPPRGPANARAPPTLA